MKHFIQSESSSSSIALNEILQLDDAFCVHYNMNQADTTGAKHMDPSDITINMCLEKDSNTKGSYVMFHGTRKLNESSNSNESSNANSNGSGNASGKGRNNCRCNGH